MSDEQLSQLSAAVGINTDWTDAFGKPQTVSLDSQRAVLEQLGFPAQSDEQIADSLARIEQLQRPDTLPALLVHDQDQPLSFGRHFAAGAAYRLELESG